MLPYSDIWQFNVSLNKETDMTGLQGFMLTLPYREKVKNILRKVAKCYGTLCPYEKNANDCQSQR